MLRFAFYVNLTWQDLCFELCFCANVDFGQDYLLMSMRRLMEFFLALFYPTEETFELDEARKIKPLWVKEQCYNSKYWYAIMT